MTDETKPTEQQDSPSALNDELEPIHCPNCQDRGWYVVSNYHTGEPEQEQCRFCYETKNSYFNLSSNALLSRAGHER